MHIISVSDCRVGEPPTVSTMLVNLKVVVFIGLLLLMILHVLMCLYVRQRMTTLTSLSRLTGADHEYSYSYFNRTLLKLLPSVPGGKK